MDLEAKMIQDVCILTEEEAHAFINSPYVHKGEVNLIIGRNVSEEVQETILEHLYWEIKMQAFPKSKRYQIKKFFNFVAYGWLTAPLFLLGYMWLNRS